MGSVYCLAVLLSAFLLERVDSKSCFYPWIEYKNHCYMFRNDKMNWHESKIECNKHDAYLARIETPSEDEWIIQQLFAISKVWYNWIGGNTLKTVGDWRWESNAEKIGYRNFAPGEPNRPKIERCLLYFSHHKKVYHWGDGTCTSKLGFICEKSNY